MTKKFYQTICSSLGLSLAAGLFQSWLHFQVGVDLYLLPSFRSWFFIGNLIALSTSVFVLTYYHRKSYQVAFSTGLVATSVIFGSLLYLFFTTLYPPIAKHIPKVMALGIITGLVYASSLFVSETKTRPWLKRAGIVSALLYVAQLVALVWFIDTPPYPVNATLDTIRQWLSLLDRIVPILLLGNFVDELQRANLTNEPPPLSNRLLIANGVVIVLAICSLILSIRLSAENYGLTHISARERALAQPFQEGSYISSQGDTLQYRLLKPIAYDPKKQYPLVVALPYTCWSDNTRQIDACPMAKWLATDKNRRKYPAFVFVPRCPPHTGWGGVTNTPSIASLAIEAIVSLDQSFSIDPQRRYISGVSRGGYGSWYMISKHPELFAAAVPVCGEGNPDQAPGMSSVSIWAFHGAKDMNVPVSGSRNMVSALKKAGGSPRYTEYPDAAHTIWEEVIKTPDLLNWLFAQKKVSPPKAAKI
ncbi:peptidase [Spirosoma sp. HMF3257]|uniref:Peptidase n=1 Tax=Spirosoma telluris TaxID=2183553 RepID=A0A327NHY2_9BACT|nr:peptidase [Spirosoma telluris]RAI74425.1 peptidase [Spirosoma telluris]